MAVKEESLETAGSLPKEAFAIVSESEDPETWKLPHHKKSVSRTIRRKLNIEKTVDWDRMAVAVAVLSPVGKRGQRIDASPGEILEAAKHMAAHYRKANKPLPDILAALV